MALDLVQRYNTRDLAVQVDSGARTVLPGTNVTFSTDPVTGAITINSTAGGSGTVTSVGLAAPVGFTVSGSPVTTTGTLTFSYTAGYVGYTTAEQTKLAGIAPGAQTGTVTSVNLGASTGLTPSGGPITTSGSLTYTLSANLQAWHGLATSAKENAITAGTTAQYWRGDKTWQTLDKAAVGLGNVDNTSDVNKPVSTAQATADNLRVLKSGDTMTGPLNVTAAGQGAVSIIGNGSALRLRSTATTNTATTLDIGQNPTGAAGDDDAYIYNRVGGIWFGTANAERGRMLTTGEFRWTGSEVQSTFANAFRMVQGSYGAIWRQDGSNFYLLFTAAADQYGSWNSLRPITVNIASGLVSHENGLSFGNNAVASSTDLTRHINLYSNTHGFNITSNTLNYVVPAANIHNWVVAGANKMSLSATQFTVDSANAVVSNGDIYTYRTGGTTGVIFLNSAANRYLYNDGSRYQMPTQGLTVGGSVIDDIGNVRDIPANVQNSSYVLQASDFGKVVEKTGTSVINYTLGSGGSAGNAITICNSGSSGDITIVRSGSSLYRNGTDADILVPPGNMVTVWRTSVAGRWQA